MITAAPPAAARLRRWQRFTLAQRVTRSVFYLSVLVAIVWSLRSIEIIPEFLYDAPQQTVDLFARMWPIDWAWYPKVVHGALIETLHTATLGSLRGRISIIYGFALLFGMAHHFATTQNKTANSYVIEITL